jgi:hypothetical protein
MRLLSIIALLLPCAGLAAECTVRSGSTTNALVELYTSEGCSSCPPADRWLSSLKVDAGIVPIGFHISYWDYIGWKDVYADERFTQRQKDLARARAKSGVYTPQVILAGEDYPMWTRARAVRESVETVQRMPPRAWIELKSRPADGRIEGVATANVADGSRSSNLALFVAVTQDGISSKVTAGENKGEKLEHNFVARDLAVIRPSADKLQGAFAFKSRPNWNADRMRLVAFVQDTKTGEVLQALSAPTCREK